jgi:hypothetical protein
VEQLTNKASNIKFHPLTEAMIVLFEVCHQLGKAIANEILYLKKIIEIPVKM